MSRSLACLTWEVWVWRWELGRTFWDRGREWSQMHTAPAAAPSGERWTGGSSSGGPVVCSGLVGRHSESISIFLSCFLMKITFFLMKKYQVVCLKYQMITLLHYLSISCSLEFFKMYTNWIYWLILTGLDFDSKLKLRIYCSGKIARSNLTNFKILLIFFWQS